MKYNRTPNHLLSDLPKEGHHQATVFHLKEGRPRKTVRGYTPSALVTFELANGQKVMQSILVFPGSTLLEKLIEATLDSKDEEVELDHLVGKACGITIAFNTVSGVTYPNIVDIFHVQDERLGITNQTETAESL